jgi:hypothetical protein
MIGDDFRDVRLRATGARAALLHHDRRSAGEVKNDQGNLIFDRRLRIANAALRV